MLSLIFAMDENQLIGKDNDLPWYLPNDLKYFKKVTTGHTIVMGRKTYESIGRPLPNRKNVILTTDQQFQANGCEIIHSLGELKPFLNNEEVFLIGGANLFKQALSMAERLYITVIHEQFEGDTYFPELDFNEWRKVEETKGTVDEKNRYDHTFFVYERD